MTRDATIAGRAPRQAALALVAGVLGDGHLLPEMIGAGALAHLSPQDKARAQRLATEVLRGLDRADRALKPHLKKMPPQAVRNVLRLGVVEIGGGAAAHGVVNDCVAIVAGGKRTRNYKGLVNAVMRKIADAGPAAWAAQPVPKMPGWLRKPMVAAWGRRDVEAFETAQFLGAPLDLTTKHDPAAVAEATGGTVLPNGTVRVSEAGQVSSLPGYETGEWWVQDAAASMPVRMLGDLSGFSALDLCAAPGGKTMQLAANGATVTAVDASAARMDRVRENLERVKLPVDVQVADAFDVTGQWDVVVLDAPCSATGTIRRHPDLPWAKDGSEFAQLIDQQGQMIDHALTLLAPGGRLMFCTCSLLPDEGEVQVEEALQRHPGLRVEAILPVGADPAWQTEEGGLRLRPDLWADRGGMDGFYMACLRRD